MPEVVILGVPKQQGRRLKALRDPQSVALREGWSFHFVNSAKDDIVSITDSVIEQALRRAEAATAIHIFSFRPRPKEQQEALHRATRPYFRMRWVDNAQLMLIPHNLASFADYLSSELGIEEQWTAEVQPVDVRSPLVLPEPSFTVAKPQQHVWRLASEAGSVDQVRGAANALLGFRNSYWRSSTGGYGAWIDEVGNVFDHSGARHGLAPFPRSMKYSYRIPEGFHFDVTGPARRAFHVRDFSGRLRRGDVGGHINIDPHGFAI